MFGLHKKILTNKQLETAVSRQPNRGYSSIGIKGHGLYNTLSCTKILQKVGDGPSNARPSVVAKAASICLCVSSMTDFVSGGSDRGVVTAQGESSSMRSALTPRRSLSSLRIISSCISMNPTGARK